MNYGMPHKGSKNKVIKWLMSLLPNGEVFVDLFCGGCAVTHAAMLSGKYKRYVFNDVDPMMPKTFAKAIQGGYRDEDRWISREDFFRLKANDEYAAICFSFGNNLRDYLYSPTIEPYKKACHYAIVFDEWELLREMCPEVVDAAYQALEHVSDRHERRLKFGPAIVRRLKEIGDARLIDSNPLYSSCHTKKPNKTRPVGTIRDLQSLQSLQSLESLERLQRLESLERLQSQFLKSYSMDYQDVPIPDSAVVYCDPPYKGTNAYGISGKQAFDHERFYEWCLTRDFPVFISEYRMPDGFTEIASTTRADSMCATATVKRTEKLFVQTKYADKYR